MTSNIPGASRPSIPAKIPAPSESAIEAATGARRHAKHWRAPDVMSRTLRAAYEIDFPPAILADREEHTACELCDVEAPWRELVANLRGQISEYITSNEGLKALLRSEGEASRAEIARLKSDLAIAETATRKALEAIPIAMDAAVVKEREACAKIADGFAATQVDDEFDHWSAGLSSAGGEIAAAIRARASEATNG